MADMSKMRRRRPAGLPPEPPKAEEARADLRPPEEPLPPRIDGRSLRRTHRTLQFATRVTPEFDARLRQIAQRDGLLLVEVLERGIEAYEAARSKPDSR